MFNDLRTQMHLELDNILNVFEAEGVVPECPQLSIQDTRTLDDGDNVTIYNAGAEIILDVLDIAHTEDRYFTVKYQITRWFGKGKSETKTLIGRGTSL